MKSFVLTILFYGINVFSQNNDLFFLRGKVISQLKELTEVNVTNFRSNFTTIIESNGNFSMFVKVGDSLQFSSLQIITKKVVINENDIVKKLFAVNLEAKVISLENVVIKTYPTINAIALGILKKPAKKYTPAERKLKAAKDFDVGYYRILMPNVFFSIDPFINTISGRTALLKKELQVERKEYLLQKIEYLFKEEYFLENLKIPKDYLRGFWYYAVEDPKLASALNAKNKMTARFIFSGLATKYLEILKN